MRLIPENITRLIKTYEKSQAKLIEIIAKSELKGNVTAYRRGVLESVKQEINSLDKFAIKWVKEEIPFSYGVGLEKAYEAYRAANIDIGKVYTNEKVIRNLVDNATGQLTDATNYVGRRISDDLRQAGLEAVAEKLSVGDTVKQTKANMLKIMSDKGITAIRDKNGREISLDAYASMVARTTTREATNKGTINAVQEVGGDLVQITSHFSSCPVCSVYEGRVYSISGNDKRYPKLDVAFTGGYMTIHPNCTHNATPYFEEFDDKAEQQRKDSNRPFTIDPEKKASIEAYNRDQAKKAARRSDRRLWEKFKILYPNETPKSFSAFRSMKKANSKKYQDLLAGRGLISNVNKVERIKNLESIIDQLEIEGRRLGNQVSAQENAVNQIGIWKDYWKDKHPEIYSLNETQINDELKRLQGPRNTLRDEIDHLYRLRDNMGKNVDDVLRLKLKEYDDIVKEMNAMQDYLSFLRMRGFQEYDENVRILAEMKLKQAAMEKQMLEARVELVELKYKDISKIAGVNKGEPMSILRADGGNPNPMYILGQGYRTNCQTCVTVYEGRLRGYDVKAKPFSKNNTKMVNLAYDSRLAYYDPKTGKFPEYVFNNSANTPLRFYEYLNEVIEPDNRYTIGVAWKGYNSGHILTVGKNTNGVFLYDPQTNTTYSTAENIMSFFDGVRFPKTEYRSVMDKPMGGPKILRVDDKYFNPDVLNDIWEDFNTK